MTFNMASDLTVKKTQIKGVGKWISSSLIATEENREDRHRQNLSQEDSAQ